METQARIKDMVSTYPVILFMKGTPEAPRCGFSNMATNILKDLDVRFAAFDVLSDPEVRQGIKEFANWPTIPQLYIKGEFVGGSDIMREMWEAGELKTMVADIE
jgi:monothiol glutaredoxin